MTPPLLPEHRIKLIVLLLSKLRNCSRVLRQITTQHPLAIPSIGLLHVQPPPALDPHDGLGGKWLLSVPSGLQHAEVTSDEMRFFASRELSDFGRTAAIGGFRFINIPSEVDGCLPQLSPPQQPLDDFAALSISMSIDGGGAGGKSRQGFNGPHPP